MNVYGICFQENRSTVEPAPESVKMAQAAMFAYLPQPAVNDTRSGFGFLIIHQRQHRHWPLLDLTVR